MSCSKNKIVSDKNNYFNEEPLNFEVKCAENLNESDDTVEGMWEKLVLYYLARLKGLCDWREYTSPGSVTNLSTDLEFKMINEITKDANENCWVASHTDNPNDIDSYIAAGYEEGKQQAAKIVVRSLKFGVLSGIIKKNGNVYRIRSEYVGKFAKRRGRPPKVRKITSHCRNKIGRKRSNLKYADSSKRSKKVKRGHSLARQCYNCDINPFPGILDRPGIKRKKIKTPRAPSASTIKTSTSSFDFQPIAKKKKTPILINKPVTPIPPRRKRTKSQTKSPTPSKSRSHKSNGLFKPRKLTLGRQRNFSPIYRSSVLSFTSSNCSICSQCDKRKKY